MLKIDEDNVVKVKTTIQGRNKTPYIYLAKALFENGLDVKPGQPLEICQDKKNKVVFFRYGIVASNKEIIKGRN